MMRPPRALGALLLSLGLTAVSLGQSGGPALKKVKYDELARLVRAQTGKVVAVSFWQFD
jgi:hypothetical protein